MAGGVANQGAALWLPSLFGLGSIPATYYIGLVSSQPLSNMTGTSVMAIEPSGGGYSRRPVATGTTGWVNTNGLISNKVDISFPTPTAAWGYITNFVICSAAGAGSLYAWGDLRSPQNIVESIAPTLKAGSLIVRMPTGN